jgi:hypothetical protein
MRLSMIRCNLQIIDKLLDIDTDRTGSRIERSKKISEEGHKNSKGIIQTIVRMYIIIYLEMRGAK